MIRFSADNSLEGKLADLKGLLAHTHPNISLGELNQWLCDFALKALKSPAPARVKSRPVQGKPLSKAAIHRAVRERDQHRCQKCGSDYALEYDHIKPKALGGKDTFANLRLLCRNCNQRAAINIFGSRKMGKYLKKRANKKPA